MKLKLRVNWQICVYLVLISRTINFITQISKWVRTWFDSGVTIRVVFTLRQIALVKTGFPIVNVCLHEVHVWTIRSLSAACILSILVFYWLSSIVISRIKSQVKRHVTATVYFIQINIEFNRSSEQIWIPVKIRLFLSITVSIAYCKTRVVWNTNRILVYLVRPILSPFLYPLPVNVNH